MCILHPRVIHWIHWMWTLAYADLNVYTFSERIIHGLRSAKELYMVSKTTNCSKFIKGYFKITSDAHIPWVSLEYICANRKDVHFTTPIRVIRHSLRVCICVDIGRGLSKLSSNMQMRLLSSKMHILTSQR